MKDGKNAYLIIGAGAVGKVFGAFLIEAGHDVLFLVKPHFRKDLEKNGIQILSRLGRKMLTIEEPKACADLEFLNRNKKRVVLVCVRSDQIESTFPTLRALPTDWPIVCFQPGFEDAEKMTAAFPDRILLQGNPGFSAFPVGPVIRSEASKRFPTLIGALDRKRGGGVARNIVEDLRRAKLPTRISESVTGEMLPLFAFCIPFLLGVEYHGFHIIAVLSDSKMFRVAHRAGRQAAAVILKAHKITPNRLQKMLMKAPLVCLRVFAQLMLAAPDSHHYQMWSAHAPKIKRQTMEMAEEISRHAADLNMPINDLKKLMVSVKNLRERAAGEPPVETPTPLHLKMT